MKMRPMKRNGACLPVLLLCMAVMTGCGKDINKKTDVISDAVADSSGSAAADAETGFEDAGMASGETGTAGGETEMAGGETGVETAAEGTAQKGALGYGWPSEPVRVENPGGTYYFAGGGEQDNPQTVTLLDLSWEDNDITDDEAWFADNGLTRPDFPYEDENYRYEIYGDDGYSAYELVLYDKKAEGAAVTLDFSDYRYARDFAEEDNSFLDQRICYARAMDGVLYVATAHNTYSASAPNTAYVTAIDLQDFHVIWKSRPLMCNANSFEIIEDAIVCGYGFTGEDDYIHILDRSNGKLWESIPIKTMAYYIIRQDDVLYVRTYDRNYRFAIKMLEPGDAASAASAEGSEFMRSYDGAYEQEAAVRGTKLRYRMVVMDAALGSRFYGLIKSRDGGLTWEEVSLDPFGGQSGMGIEFTFLTETFGFATLSHNGGDSAILYVTEDGGKHYTESAIEERYVTLSDGTTYVPYDFPRMPYEEDGKLYVQCGQGADGDYAGGDGAGLAQFWSEDGGHSFSFDRMVTGDE